MRQILVIATAVGCALGQSPGTFTATGSMATARTGHTATLLTDGRVLIAGGSVLGFSNIPGPIVVATAEIYDAFSGAFTATGSMATPRNGHTATLLPDGRVLVAGGGYPGVGLAPAAELYNPATGVFSLTGNLTYPRSGHSAILLANGKVLILGGGGVSGYPEIAPAEIYDPDTGIFTPAGPYVGNGECDFCAPSTRLVDGRVLFPQQNQLQIYDPATGTFSLTGNMPHGYTAAALLMNGKVLFAGGVDLGRIASADLYDSLTGAFSSTGAMGWSRVGHTLTLLPDGKVLAAGGETDSCISNGCFFAGTTATAELYDPAFGTFSPTGSMAQAREEHTATLLNDGRVLVAGGEAYEGIWPNDVFDGSTASAELYRPEVLIPAPRLFLLSGDRKGQGAGWHPPSGQAASPAPSAVAGEALSLYAVNLTEGAVIPPQVFIGGKPAEILYFGDAPGYRGFSQVNVRVPDGVTPGSAVPVRLAYLGRWSNEVTISVQ